MPHYDYKCENCGIIFEVFHSISEKPVDVCVECKGKVKRLIGGGAGVIFKGSGFYKTDYSNKPSCSENSSACSSCPSSGAK